MKESAVPQISAPAAVTVIVSPMAACPARPTVPMSCVIHCCGATVVVPAVVPDADPDVVVVVVDVPGVPVGTAGAVANDKMGLRVVPAGVTDSTCQ